MKIQFVNTDLEFWIKTADPFVWFCAPFIKDKFLYCVSLSLESILKIRVTPLPVKPEVEGESPIIENAICGIATPSIPETSLDTSIIPDTLILSPSSINERAFVNVATAPLSDNPLLVSAPLTDKYMSFAIRDWTDNKHKAITKYLPIKRFFMIIYFLCVLYKINIRIIKKCIIFYYIEY